MRTATLRRQSDPLIAGGTALRENWLFYGIDTHDQAHKSKRVGSIDHHNFRVWKHERRDAKLRWDKA